MLKELCWKKCKYQKNVVKQNSIKAKSAIFSITQNKENKISLDLNSAKNGPWDKID